MARQLWINHAKDMDLFCRLLFYMVRSQNTLQFLAQNGNVIGPKALWGAHALAGIFKFEIDRSGAVKDIPKKIFDFGHFPAVARRYEQPQPDDFMGIGRSGLPRKLSGLSLIHI